MTTQEHEVRSLQQLDAAEQEQVAEVEEVVKRVVDSDSPPSTITDLIATVRQQLGRPVDADVLRAAVLAILNGA
jgi:hypothetical protein